MFVTRIFIRNKHSSLLLQKAVENIEKSSKILVMAGAGLSTPSGIPDFRSPGSGIYDNLKQFNLPYPEAIFDIQYFRYARLLNFPLLPFKNCFREFSTNNQITWSKKLI
jgi:hypothetical protein